MTKLFVSIVFALVLVACRSNPESFVLPSDPTKWENNEEIKAEIDKLPDQDKKLVSEYMIRMSIATNLGGADVPSGTTIGQAIEKQREWMAGVSAREASEKATAIAAQAKQDAKAAALKDVASVTVTAVEILPEDWESGRYSQAFAATVVIQNRSDKTISGVMGAIVVKDIFGNTIKSLGFTSDDGVTAKSDSTDDWYWDLNEFMDSDMRLANTEFSKMTFEWVPETYVFEDGTKISVND